MTRAFVFKFIKGTSPNINMNKKMKTKLLMVLIFFALCGPIFSAQAIEYGQIGGKPTNFDPSVPDSKSWFIYHLDAGAKKEDSITIINLFEEKLVANIYAADSIKSSSGGFALKQISEEKKEVGSWVKFYPDPKPDYAKELFKDEKKIFEVCAISQEDLEKKYELSAEQIGNFAEWCKGKNEVSLTMKTKEKIDVPFVISIPENAEVGEHTGGILIQKQGADQTEQSDGSKVLLTTRVGVRIYETVPGEVIKKLSFSDFSVAKNFDEFFWPWNKDKRDKFSEYTISSSVKNSGNVSVDFKEKIIIKNLITKKTENINDRDFQVLRDDNFSSIFAWKAPRLAYMSFQKEYTYKDASDKEQTESSEILTKWFLPWREFTFVLVFLLVVITVYILVRRRWKKLYGGIGWGFYTIQAGDSIATVSQKFAVDWKTLIRTNKLKAPYLLETGKVIKVPGGVENKTVVQESNKTEIETEVVAEPKIEKILEKISGNMPEIKLEKIMEVKKDPEEESEKELEKEPEKEPKIAKTIEEKIENFVTKKIAVDVQPEKDWSVWKKIFLGISLVALGVVITLAFVFFLNKKEEPKENKNLTLNTQNSVPKEEVAVKTEEKLASEKPKEIDPLTMKIKILNGGAVAGTAGKIKEFLTSKKYQDLEAKNAESDLHIGTVVFYASENLKSEAEWIGKLLEAKKIKAEVKIGVTDEEKSGDVVIILGE